MSDLKKESNNAWQCGKKNFWSLFLLYLSLLPHVGLMANNIQLSNASITQQGSAADTCIVQFNLSWENSWRTSSAPNNWDAAWVFVKFRVGESDPTFTGVSSSDTTVTVSSTANLRVGMPVVKNSGTGVLAANTVINSITNDSQFVLSAAPSTPLTNATITCVRIWEHAYLDTTDAKHSAPAGSTIQVPNDGANGLGAFVFRDTIGSGTFSLSNVGLVWKYGSNGLGDNDYFQIKVFAIEMVYVTKDSFAAGSGGNEDSPFTLTTINTPAANTAPSDTGSLGGKAGGYPENETSPNASWPNGFNAFYCMKYEMSQGQYRDFLNTLTRSQQSSRTASNCAEGVTSITNRYVMTNKDTVLNRNVIRCDTVVDANLPISFYCDLDRDGIGNESNDGEWIACNFLSWMDACAFMDWAGLRPMTELEYEKACRGPATPSSNEYLASFTRTAYGFSNAGTSTESYTSSGPNFVYQGSTNGPYRVGVFSGASTNRNDAGAAYYGIMEMGGNVSEPTVTISNVDGRAYTGLHGDGALSDLGRANTTNWPGMVSGELTAASGAGNRGGSYDGWLADLRISDRSFADDSSTKRTRSYGCRAVRTAP